ncbi:MAG: hypothetical protein ACI9OJ_003387 [Myxococcota bacterium]
MSRVVIVLSVFFVFGCSGFSIDVEDGGPTPQDAGAADGGSTDVVADDVGLDASSDAASDTGPRDAGPCTLGELCDDGNACTEGERCGESGCAGGSVVTCMGPSTRCEADTLIEGTFTGACDEIAGCVADEVVTMCTFSCAEFACTSCRTTDWAQASLPFVVRDSAAASAQFAIDEAGGQHILFPTERLNGDFLEVAVDYAYRSGDGATWKITPIKPPGNYLPDLSIALHHQEAHFLIVTETALTYWRPEGGTWVEESVPGVAYEDNADLVVRPDGEPHVMRAGSLGLMHAQRTVGGLWTEERVEPRVRPREVRALLLGDDIRVLFREGDDSLGFARYDGSDWTVRTESVGERAGNPEQAIAPDGTLVTSYAIGDGDIGVGTISVSGEWSSVLLTGSISRVSDEHSIAIDSAGGTHVVFQGLLDRATRYAYRRPGGDVFTFREIVRGTESGFNLLVDDLGKLRMVSRHVLERNPELRFSTRQTCP